MCPLHAIKDFESRELNCSLIWIHFVKSCTLPSSPPKKPSLGALLNLILVPIPSRWTARRRFLDRPEHTSNYTYFETEYSSHNATKGSSYPYIYMFVLRVYSTRYWVTWFQSFHQFSTPVNTHVVIQCHKHLRNVTYSEHGVGAGWSCIGSELKRGNWYILWSWVGIKMFAISTQFRLQSASLRGTYVRIVLAYDCVLARVAIKVGARTKTTLRRGDLWEGRRISVEGKITENNEK